MKTEPAADRFVAALAGEHKDKTRHIGEKHEIIRQIKAIIANTKTNPEKLFVAEGIWSHNKILELNAPVRTFVLCPQFIYTAQAAKIAETMLDVTGEAYLVSDKTFMKVSERDKADGLLSVCRFPEYDINSFILNKNTLITVLDGCEIPGNVGTIARTCDGAAVDAVFLCNRRVRLTHPKVIKGSMGGALTVPFYEFTTTGECIEWLVKNRFNIYVADASAEKFYYEYDYSGRTALVMGSERYGPGKEWYVNKTHPLSIPMLGSCDSLNVGVAASIILYDMSVKLKK